ncbi:site-2 protease family protein [Paraoerskovia marina]|uniref:site-2 protease family protein n=1 Tax=Paraoerskovia marina TaxID=545619 RepID=UPI0012DD63B1|nr:site-2 protease family protein [Paraoerskovia marina]
MTSPSMPPRTDPPRSRGLVLGRIADAPVVLTPSWAIAAVVLTIVFAPTVRFYAPGQTGVIYGVSFAFVVLLFGSVFLHEVSHALVARARGQHVTELAITVWGGHTAFTGSLRRPRDAFWVAVVGPLTNLVLAGGFWFLFELRTGTVLVWLLCYAAAVSNAFVGLFNLIPGLPLDGGQMLAAAVWAATGSQDRGTVVAGYVGRVVAVGSVLAVIAVPLAQGGTVEPFLVIWAVFIGMFLWSGASGAIRSGRARARLAHLDVSTFMHPAATVPADGTVADTAAAGRGAGAWAVVILDGTGRPVGVVDPANAAQVPADRLTTTSVWAVAHRLPLEALLRSTSAGPDLVAGVVAAAPGTSVVPVVDETGTVVGVVLVREVLAAVRGTSA